MSADKFTDDTPATYYQEKLENWIPFETRITIAMNSVIFFHRKFNNRIINNRNMPKFLDSHDLKGVDPIKLRELQDAPRDEFGVSHLNIIYNQEEDKCYCLLDAPNIESIEKHHEKVGYQCDFIMPVDSTFNSKPISNV